MIANDYVSSKSDQNIAITIYGKTSRTFQEQYTIEIKPNMKVFAGTFLKDITPDPTWSWAIILVNGNHTSGESGILPFCDAMETIEQPNRRNNTCPPEKGFGLISIRTFVPWLFPDVGPERDRQSIEADECAGELYRSI
jgi:hypothetical protein